MEGMEFMFAPNTDLDVELRSRTTISQTFAMSALFAGAEAFIICIA